jgi:hypothetical protein
MRQVLDENFFHTPTTCLPDKLRQFFQVLPHDHHDQLEMRRIAICHLASL